MPINLFISYKRQDIGFAKELKRRVDTADIGVSCWYDEYIPLGDDWKAAIDNEIESSAGVIVVVTVAALKSQYVTYEWSYAMGAKKRVIPVILEIPNEERDGIVLHPKLEATNAVMFTESYNWDALLNKLKQIAKQEHIPPEIRRAEYELYDPDMERAGKAIKLLEKHPHSHAVELLAEAAQSQSPDLARNAGLVLAVSTNNEDERAIPGLIQYLNTDLRDTRQALNALIAMNSPVAALAIWEELQKITDVRRRKEVINALTHFTHPSVIPMLIELLHIEISNYDRIIESLGEFADSRATIPMIELINRWEPQMNLNIKIAVVQAIARIGDPIAIDPLTDIFKMHSDVHRIDTTDLCNTIISTIGEIGGEHAASSLAPLKFFGRNNYRQAIENTINNINARIRSSEDTG